MKNVFIALFILGAAAPYAALAPWLWAHGLSIELFVGQMFANPIASAFALDVIVSAIVLMFAAYRFGGFTVRELAAIGGATLLVGVSAGLPLSGYFWVRSRPAT